MTELGSYELPKGWRWATIPDLVGEDGVFIDGDWVESKDQDPNGDVRLVQLADVGDGTYRDKSARFLTSEKAAELRCTFLKEGDVLIARMPDPLGRACVFPGDSKASVTVVDVCIARSGNGEFDHRWLAWFVNAYPFRSAVAGLQSGSTRKRISRGNLSTIPLPVPPPDEQRRIVAEIEKQFTRLETGAAALPSIKAKLKRYRAAVLKAACEGKLVPTEKNKWKEMSLPQFVSRVPNSIRRGPFGSAIKKDFFVCEGYKVYQQQNAIYDDFSLGNYFIDGKKFDELSSFEVKPKDLIISCSGTVGRIAVVPEWAQPGIINQALLKLTLDQAIVLNSFFVIMFRHRVREFLIAGSRGAAMQNIAGVSELKKFRWRIPPAAEQERIIAEVERRLSVIEELEAVVLANLYRTTRLRQSILQRAFAGELIPPSQRNSARAKNSLE